MSHPSPAAEFLERLDWVAGRLDAHAGREPSGGLTDPDPGTGERWEWGQVWAHLAEFIPYWMSQVMLIARTGGSDPVPFGRVKSDPVRVAAIEADRAKPVPELGRRLSGHLVDLRLMLSNLPPAAWGRRGLHQTLGVMDMPRIVHEFMVGHLESHAAQLDQLAAVFFRE